MPGSKRSLYDVTIKNKLINPTKNQALFEKIQEGGSIRVYKRIATINIIYHDKYNNRNIRSSRRTKNGSKRRHPRAKQHFSKTTRSRKKFYDKNNNKKLDEIRTQLKEKIRRSNSYDVP